MKFSADQMLAAFTIEQLILAWAAELDSDDGRGMAWLLTEDCSYVVRAEARSGRDAVSRFYAERYETLVRDAGHTPGQRHVISNMRFDIARADFARAAFSLLYFASPKTLPADDLDGPMALADCQMTCARQSDGRWLIASFDSTQMLRRAPR